MERFVCVALAKLNPLQLLGGVACNPESGLCSGPPKSLSS